MVMTARAAYGQAKKGFGAGTNHFINGVGADLSSLGGILISHIIIWTTNQESGSNFDIRLIGAELVTGKMLLDQSAQGFVLIKRTDDVVTERPGVSNDFVTLKSATFTKTYDIQPVPPPSFPVMRRGQESIHQMLVRIR